MRTSRDIYNQILWDPGFDKNQFCIGCRDRSGKIEDKAFIEFDPSTIPWDRVWYFKMGDTIVWDRNERLDRLNENSIRKLAKSMAQKPIKTQKAFLNQQPIYSYRGNNWQQFDIDTIENTSHFPIQTLTIITFNILFDLYQQEEIYSQQRQPITFSLLKNYNADIIALQEVTPQFLQQLLDQKWVQQNYYVTDNPQANTIENYGQILLSRFPLTKLGEHKYSNDKKVIVAETVIQNQTICFGVVHLSSSRANNPVQKRNEQIKALLSHFQTNNTYDACIILGDFNYSVAGEEESLNQSEFLDIWNELHPNDKGYTFDPKHNSLAHITSRSQKSYRYDRIFYQSKKLQLTPQEIFLIATESQVVDGNEYYCSDHYGLHTKISFCSNEFRPTYHSSLVIVPPQESQPAIQEIREKHDKQFERWMPHINLLYGFFHRDHFDQAATMIKEVLSSFSPFIINLQEFVRFQHHASSTVWLKPTTEPPGILHELQACLEKLFPPCNEQSQKSSARYTPHLSVGQFKDDEECINQLAQWQQNWQTISFEVKQIHLISRQENDPFAIRHSITLGQKSKQSSLQQYLTQNNYCLTQIEMDTRKEIIQKVNKAYTQLLINNDIEFINEGLYLIGSSCLKVENPGGDIDLTVIGPCTLLRQDFFKEMQTILSSYDSVTEIRIITNAIVPLLKMKFDGIDVDILYSCFPKNISLCNPHYLTTKELQKFSEKDLQAILGYLEPRVILNCLQERAEIFRITLPLIKKWAKARGIDTNGFGYPGGFSWTLLVAWICIRAHKTIDTPEELIQYFFITLNNWNWQKSITVAPESRTYEQEEHDKITIVTPLFPYKNSARNITKSTLEIVKIEFQRAAKIVKQQSNPETWDKLLIPVEHNEYKQYICCEVIANSQVELTQCAGWIEGHFLSLLLKLEKITDSIRPYPQFISSDNFKVGKFFIGINECDQKQLQDVMNNFIHRFQAWGKKPENCKLEIKT